VEKRSEDNLVNNALSCAYFGDFESNFLDLLEKGPLGTEHNRYEAIFAKFLFHGFSKEHSFEALSNLYAGQDRQVRPNDGARRRFAWNLSGWLPVSRIELNLPKLRTSSSSDSEDSGLCDSLLTLLNVTTSVDQRIAVLILLPIIDAVFVTVGSLIATGVSLSNCLGQGYLYELLGNLDLDNISDSSFHTRTKFLSYLADSFDKPATS
jgi:hypothetical protein